MKKPLALGSVAAALVATIIGVVAVNNASAAVTTYTVAIAGANEVTPGTVTDYTGTATITIDSVSFQVCVDATLNENGANDPVIANHIHMGASGTAGGIVIPSGNMSFPSLQSCTTSDGPTTQAVIANPSGFYYNIHTTAHTGGAARGQLVLQAATTTVTPTTVAPTTTIVSPTSTARAVTAVPSFTG